MKGFNIFTSNKYGNKAGTLADIQDSPMMIQYMHVCPVSGNVSRLLHGLLV